VKRLAHRLLAGRLRFAAAPAARGALATAAGARHGYVPTAAVILILGAVFCFTLLDTVTKYTARLYPIALLVWARYTVQLIAMVAWLGRSMGMKLLHTRRPRLQLLRAGLLVVSSVLFANALRTLPLADATAINYCTPVLVVLVAVLVLHERMSRVRVAFVVAGLIGMLLIVRPGTDMFRGSALYALAAAACYAFYQISTRMLSDENPLVVLFYPALVGTGLMTLAAPTFDWPAHMPWQHVALLVLMGLLGTLGHFLFIHAFRRAPASGLTPFTYVQLVFAMLVGFAVYGDFPDASTLLGMAVIAGSGLYLTLHERRRQGVANPATMD
jgi:drug/metabolite transporter (DMT)-like permease